MLEIIEETIRRQHTLIEKLLLRLQGIRLAIQSGFQSADILECIAEHIGQALDDATKYYAALHDLKRNL